MSDLSTSSIDRRFLAGPVYRAHAVAARVLEPPPEFDVNAWAEDHLVLGSESPFPGPYRGDRFPFFRRILEALSPDDPARTVTLIGSAQIGKTLLAMIFIAASLDLDPGQILYVHPTEPNATRFARTKWRPLIRETPRLSEILDTKQSKEGGNSTLYQERRDGRGSILLGGANSAASLSMITVKRQVQDDLSKWENNSAGDPEAQADSRSKAFFDAKILKLSTPLLAPNCRITRAFASGSQHHYHVPCPHCGHMHVLDPENFISSIDPDAPELAHFTCPACGCEIHERDRADIVARGEWRPHNPGAVDLSFAIWAAYAPLERWERMARNYLAAQDDPAAEQVWWNDTGGRAYELPGEAPSWEALRTRAEAGGRRPGQIPPGALILTLTLDVQDDYIDGVLVGWGSELRRWVVARVRVEGFIDTPETRAELNRLVEFEWPAWNGTRRRADLVGIDAGAWTDQVHDWAKGHPKSRVLMLRGVSGDAAPVLALVRRERRPDGKLTKYQGRFYNVGVNGLKGALYKFLRVEIPGARGYVDFPAGLDDDYFEQLTSEKRTPIIDRRGFTVYSWVKPRGVRNEQLDVMVYGQALATKLGWRVMTPAQWDRLAAARDGESESGPSDEHAANEFWNKEATSLPVVEENAPPAPALSPRPPAQPAPDTSAPVGPVPAPQPRRAYHPQQPRRSRFMTRRYF